LRKAGALLDCLTDGELTVPEIAARLGEPRSSVYRLLAGLHDLGLVEPGVRRRTYRLGLKLLRLASAVMASFDERQVALPLMQRVHDVSGETVYLCVRRDFEAVCIERIDGRRVQSLALKLGGALPLHAGAVARALLAYEPEEFWEHYVTQADLEVFTPSTPASAEALIPELRKIREEGVAISDQDVTVGIAAIGAPIFDISGKVRAAVSISGIRSEILGADSHARKLITEAAATVSRQLGFGLAQEGVMHS
jgi:DNA-binding IclR family transcriptional regulator